MMATACWCGGRVADVRIFSRIGADFTERFPRIVEAARRPKVRSVLLDGECIVYNSKGMPDFGLLIRLYDSFRSD